MKLTFIGSSHGVPEAHRKCTCMMVEAGKNVYFVDMGTSAIDALRTRGISIDRVKGIFITHMHGDHTNGLIPFVDLISWYFKTPEPVICLPDMAAAEVMESWLRVCMNHEPVPARYAPVAAGNIFDDGTVSVTAIPTRHCPNSYGYLLEAEGKRILFTGDLMGPGKDFPETEGPLDLVVCESAHFAATEYLPVFAEKDIKKTCITHYSDKFLASVLQTRQALAERGIPCLIATDDLEISL